MLLYLLWTGVPAFLHGIFSKANKYSTWQMHGEGKEVTHLASRKRERNIMTASHVLCFSCSSIAVNLRRIIDTIRSISFGAIGRVRLCSRSRFTTWLVNSLHAWKHKHHVYSIYQTLHRATESRTVQTYISWLWRSGHQHMVIKLHYINTEALSLFRWD